MFYVYLLLCSLILTGAGNENALRIETSPKNQTVTAGSPAFFICTAVGNPRPQIEWQRNSRRLFSSRYSKHDIPNGSILRIEPVRESRDDAEFTCVADNGIGDPVTATAVLTVLSGRIPPRGFPQFVPQMSAQVTERGRSVLLPCKVYASPPPKITWLKNMLPINMSVSRYSVVSSSLEITDIEDSDEGQYECFAENSVGSAMAYPIHLYVKVRREAPHFAILPDPLYEVVSGSNLNLTCVAVGRPMPYVKWQTGSVEIGQNDYEPILKNVLTLKNITSSANYTCIAGSQLGTVKSTTEIRVKERRLAPKFTILPDLMYKVKPGSDLNITCAAIGDPMPSVEWLISCTEITPQDNIPIGENILFIENITLPANYTCIAKSELGTIGRTTAVVVSDVNQYLSPGGFPKIVRLSECACERRPLLTPKNKNCTPVYQAGCACADRFVCPDDDSEIDALTTPGPECVYEGKSYRFGEEIKTTDYCANCSCKAVPEGAEMVCEVVECPDAFQLPADRECYQVFEDNKCCAVNVMCVPTEPELTVSLVEEYPQIVVEVSWSESFLEYEHLEKYKLRYGRTNTSQMDEIILNAEILNYTVYGLDHGANYSFYLSAWSRIRWGPEAVAYLRTPQGNAIQETQRGVLTTDLPPSPKCPKCDLRYLQHYEVKNCYPVFAENCSCPSWFDCPAAQTTPGNVCLYKEKIYQLREVIPTGNPCQRCSCRRSNLGGAGISCLSVECPSQVRRPPEDGCYEVYKKDRCCSVGVKCADGKVHGPRKVVNPELLAVVGGKAYLPCDITASRKNDSVDMIFWYKDYEGRGISFYTVDSRKTSLESARHIFITELGSRAVFEIAEGSATLIIDPVKAHDDGVYSCRADFYMSPTNILVVRLHVEPTCEYDGKTYHLGERIYPKTYPCLSCICNENWTESSLNDCQLQECLLERKLRYLRKGCVPIYHEDRCCPTDFYCGTGADVVPNNDSYTQSPGSCVFEGKSYSVGEVLDTRHPTNCITCTCEIPPDFTCIRKTCPGPPRDDYANCRAIYHEGECCPTYDCLQPPACQPAKCLSRCQEVTGMDGCPACLCDKLLCTIPKCPIGCEVEYDVPDGNCPRCRCFTIVVQLAPVRCSPVQCDPQCFEVIGSNGCLTCICGPLCSTPKCGAKCILQTVVPRGQCRGCICPSNPNRDLVDDILYDEEIQCAPVICSPMCRETVGKFGCPTCICDPCPPLNCSSGCEVEPVPLSGRCPNCVCNTN